MVALLAILEVLECGLSVLAVLISNLGGTTSALLGIGGGDAARRAHLDTLYPIRGYKRCLDSQNSYGEPA